MPGQISYYVLLDNGKIWSWSYSGGSMLDGLMYTLVFAALFSIFGLLLVVAIRFMVRKVKIANRKMERDPNTAG